MKKQIDALKLALEALESCGSGHITDGGKQWFDEKLVDKAYAAIEEVLSQPEQEPVGEAYLCDECRTPFNDAWECPSCGHNMAVKEPVYTTPPQRTWVGLTGEEINTAASVQSWKPFAKAIEAKLRSKNNE